MSVRLFVGNLPKATIERNELQAVFQDLNESVTTKVIKDRKTGKCRGFAFVTVPNDEIADQLIEKYNGHSFMENPLKIEKALPRAKGKNTEENATPTPEKSEKPGEAKPNAGRRNPKGRGKRQNQTINHQDNDAIQPDPRWADELVKLKEILAQTNNA